MWSRLFIRSADVCLWNQCAHHLHYYVKYYVGCWRSWTIISKLWILYLARFKLLYLCTIACQQGIKIALLRPADLQYIISRELLIPSVKWKVHSTLECTIHSECSKGVVRGPSLCFQRLELRCKLHSAFHCKFMTPISGVWFHSLCFWLSADVCLISTIRTAISPAVSNTHTRKQACSLLLSHIHRYAHRGNISPSWPWARSAIIRESLDKESRSYRKSWLLSTWLSGTERSLI